MQISISLYAVTDHPQTPMLPSVVSPHTCSSPTISVRTSAKRTPASASVRLPPSAMSQHLANSLLGQVGKVLGDRWKALSEKQREPYEKKAATDKKRYEDEKAKYNVSPSFRHRKARAMTDQPTQAGDDDETSD